MHDKIQHVIQIRNLKQALNRLLVLKELHRFIKMNQKSWLKPCTDMKTDPEKALKNDFEKDFFKLMNESVFGKSMENARKYRDIKLVTNETRSRHLVSKSRH